MEYGEDPNSNKREREKDFYIFFLVFFGHPVSIQKPTYLPFFSTIPYCRHHHHFKSLLRFTPAPFLQLLLKFYKNTSFFFKKLNFYIFYRFSFSFIHYPFYKLYQTIRFSIFYSLLIWTFFDKRRTIITNLINFNHN